MSETPGEFNGRREDIRRGLREYIQSLLMAHRELALFFEKVNGKEKDFGIWLKVPNSREVLWRVSVDIGLDENQKAQVTITSSRDHIAIVSGDDVPSVVCETARKLDLMLRELGVDLGK